MQNSNILPKTHFHTLSDDLKAFIFEFLTLTDLHTLQLVSNDFYSFLERTPRLWAIQLFLLFLDYVPEDDGFWEPPLYNEKLKIDEESVSFSSMSKESKSLLKSHFVLKKQYQKFFNRFLLTQQTDELIKEIFNIFRRPPYPMPCLKRDIHIFPTDTLFQNFLTEVHFGLHSRCSLTDRKQLMMEGLVEKIRTSPSSRNFDIAKLLLLRWYSIGSTEIFGREFAPEPLHNVDQTFNFQEDSDMANTQKSLTPKPLARKGRQDLKLIEEFYSLVNDLLVNHCKAVSTYLKAIKMDTDILNEYMRFWNGFVMATIALNRALLPFSQHINRLYNETCPNLPKSPEFSTWRMMIKVWLDQIFAPTSDRLFTAFRRTMASIRNLNGLDELFKEVTHQDSEDNVFLGFPCNTEKSIMLLRRFYLAMCDLSYDEFSIFFKECTGTQAGTPQGQLNEAIIEDTNKIYDCAGELLFVKPENVQFFFKKDIEITETIFGKELALKIREKQVSVLKNSLTRYLDTVSQGLDSSPTEDNILSSSHTRAFKSANIDRLNIAGMISVLKPQEDQAQKIRLEKKIREDLVRKMGNKPVHLNSFFHLMTDLTDLLEKQHRDREEAMRTIIVERGLEPMEERHQCFFALNKNPLRNATVIKEIKEQR